MLRAAPVLTFPPTRISAFPASTGGRDGGWFEGVRLSGLLCLLCVVLYAPGLATIPPLDRDEARFAQTTRQMLETGDFIRIRFQDEARNKKPVAIYWLQAAAVAALSTPENAAIWPYRLPSAAAATAMALLVFAFGARFLGSRRSGFIAAVLTASALGVIAEAHLAKTDAVLLAAVVAAQGTLGLVYIASRKGDRNPRWLPLVFWLAEAAAILLKGPAGPVLALLTIAAVSIADRDIRWIRGLQPAAGLCLMVLVVAPWVIAIESATNGSFIADSFANDLLPKLVGSQESHGAPPGYYVALALGSFWPGSLFIVPAAIWGWRHRRVPVGRFLVAWLVPAWVFLELMPTKLPHYVLPLYPALAMLAGAALTEGLENGLTGRVRSLGRAVKALWAAVTGALAAALIVLPSRFGGDISPAAILAPPILLGLALLLLLGDRNPGRAACSIAALAAAFVLPAALAVAPSLNSLWLSRSAAGLVTRHPPAPGEAVLSVGYSEPSLVFLLGTATRLVSAIPSERQLAGAGLALVRDRDDAEFRRTLTVRGWRLRAIDHVAGIDYSAGGSSLVLTLYKLDRG